MRLTIAAALLASTVVTLAVASTANAQPAPASASSGRYTARQFYETTAYGMAATTELAFSRDGQFVVTAAGEPGLVGEAKLFQAADGSLVKEFLGHKDSLYCAALSPDGQILATGSYDSSIKLWNVTDGKELRSLDGHNGAVFELAFRHDGKVLASASGDRTVKLLDRSVRKFHGGHRSSFQLQSGSGGGG